MGKPAALLETLKDRAHAHRRHSRHAEHRVGECDGIGAVHGEVNWRNRLAKVVAWCIGMAEPRGTVHLVVKRPPVDLT